jgi:asparagine synthase (glutamine-hydrolysing)
MTDGGSDEWAVRLARELQESVKRSLAGTAEAAVAFSGGLDSSVLALLASRQLQKVTLYTVGLPGARDLFMSRRAAEALDMRAMHVRLEVDEREVLDAARAMGHLLPESNMVEVAFTMPAYLVFFHARETAVLTGDGADELFGGYHRYLGMEAPELAASLQADTRRLVQHGILQNRLLARSLGKELRTPYLTDGLVELALAIPPGRKVEGGQRKLVLRKAAELLGVPPDISNLPKTAAQYGSSVMKVLRKHPELFPMNEGGKGARG